MRTLKVNTKIYPGDVLFTTDDVFYAPRAPGVFPHTWNAKPWPKTKKKSVRSKEKFFLDIDSLKKICCDFVIVLSIDEIDVSNWGSKITVLVSGNKSGVYNVSTVWFTHIMSTYEEEFYDLYKEE